jgi:hypothetical protein
MQNINYKHKKIITTEGDILEVAHLIKDIGIKGSVNFFKVFNLFFLVSQKNIQSRFQIKKFRALFNKYTVDIVKDKTGADFLAVMKKEVQIMRDAYIVLETDLKRIRTLNFLLHKPVNNTLKEWEDLLEDFEIGTDPEIHSLIQKISEAF